MTALRGYLDELEAELGLCGPRRRRILREVEEHLRDSAAKLGSEEEAVARFGSPGPIAQEFRAQAAAAATAQASLALLALIVGLISVSYTIPENLLPAATWAGPEPPFHLHWKMRAISVLLALALILAAAAAARRSARALHVALALLAAQLVLSVALAVEWAREVPGSELALTVTGGFQAAILGGAAAVAVSERRRSARLLRR